MKHRRGLAPAMQAAIDNAIADAATAADATAITFVASAEAGIIDEVTAGEHTSLFAPWAVDVDYTVGQIREDGGELYKCAQAHRSQADWKPALVPALWKKIGDPTDEWPEWAQPVGAHDAYAKGDKVTHQGKRWVSDCDANVWEPGVAMWTLQA